MIAQWWESSDLLKTYEKRFPAWVCSSKRLLQEEHSLFLPQVSSFLVPAPLLLLLSLSLSIFFSLLLAENTTPHSNTSELEAASWSKEMNVNPSSAVDLDHLAWNLALTLYFHIVWIICLFDPHFLATAEKPSFLIFGSLPITNRTEQSNLCCPQTLSEMHTCVLALNFRIICQLLLGEAIIAMYF